MPTTAPVRLGSIVAKHWKMCIYGVGGAGKSIFAASSKKLRIFYFDIDHSMESVAAHYAREQLDSTRLKIWDVQDTGDFWQGLAWFERNISQFDLCVIDTASELQRMMIRDLLKKSNKVAAEQADWGVILKTFEDLASAMRNKMPVHTLWLAHDMYKGDEFVKTAKWRPSFEGAFRMSYIRHFGVVGRLQLNYKRVAVGDKIKVEVVRAIEFKPSPITDTKDRSGALNGWEPADLDALLEKMTESVKIGGKREETYDESPGDYERVEAATQSDAQDGRPVQPEAQKENG